MVEWVKNIFADIKIIIKHVVMIRIGTSIRSFRFVVLVSCVISGLMAFDIGC